MIFTMSGLRMTVTYNEWFMYDRESMLATQSQYVNNKRRWKTDLREFHIDSSVWFDKLVRPHEARS